MWFSLQCDQLLVFSSLTWLEISSLPQYWIAPVPHLLARLELLTPPEDVVTPSGLRIEMVKTSVYCRPIMAGDLVTLHYTGTLASTGEEFDRTQPGDPVTLVVGEGRQLAGWEEGLVGRCQGDELRLTVPPHLGYGDQGLREAGQGGEEEVTEEFVIPPGATLVFNMRVVKVE